MNVQTLLQSQNSKSIDITHISSLSFDSFCEQDILNLNDLLLTNGVHEITIKNMVLGRNILDTFLTLLNHHQQVYWLSDKPLTFHVYDLHAMLQKHDFLKRSSEALYEAYFYEEFYADCLIIECTDTLNTKLWYTEFESALYKTDIAERIPVIKLYYQENVCE